MLSLFCCSNSAFGHWALFQVGTRAFSACSLCLSTSFLAPQDASCSSFIFPYNSSGISPFCMEPCFQILETDNLETKIWALNMLCCYGSVIVSGSLQQTELKICIMHINLYIHAHLSLYLYILKTLSYYRY